jgi:hypothetical protein
MQNLLAQKGCSARLIYLDTWSLTLSNTDELRFDSEIELCDFLEGLPDMNPSASALNARGYASLRSTIAITPDQALHQQHQTPPVEVDSRAVNDLPEKGGRVLIAIALMTAILMVFKVLDDGGLPSGFGWVMLFGYTVSSMAVAISAGLITFFFFSEKQKRIHISLLSVFIIFVLAVVGKFI